MCGMAAFLQGPSWGRCLPSTTSLTSHECNPPTSPPPCAQATIVRVDGSPFVNRKHLKGEADLLLVDPDGVVQVGGVGEGEGGEGGTGGLGDWGRGALTGGGTEGLG